VERSALLDTSKFVRIAVDWLLRSDIGEVIKTIVDDEKFPGLRNAEKLHREKKAAAMSVLGNAQFPHKVIAAAVSTF
jgi:hypothetical protein